MQEIDDEVGFRVNELNGCGAMYGGVRAPGAMALKKRLVKRSINCGME